MGVDLDAFEERAAIAEFDGGLSRFQAETLAAQAQGFERWEAIGAISKRVVEQALHQREALARQKRQVPVPRMQPHTTEKE